MWFLFEIAGVLKGKVFGSIASIRISVVQLSAVESLYLIKAIP
jgi:hypothetical protein